METWKDMKDFFWPAVQDTEAGQMFFSIDQVVSWHNSALYEMAQHAQYFDDIKTQNTVVGTSKYATSTRDVFGLWRVEIDGQAIRPVTQKQLRDSDRNWATKTGKPKFYYLDNTTEAPGAGYVWLYPSPGSVYELRTYSYAQPSPADLPLDGEDENDESSKISVPKWAIYGVLWYMLSEAYLAETRRQNLDTSAYYRMLYEDILDRLLLRTNDKLGSKSWSIGSTPTQGVNDFWHNLPDTIPEPV